ncbi:hypothetical protein ACFVYG_20120 [Streptomyces sp. NPDC058256]|uniref:hypothetical protein n=1 Tax=Streptomyces sp. NPDC058256 TaxID=3346408 RepID=UPI0036E49912
MTTHVQRTPIVTARIDTPAPADQAVPAADAPAAERAGDGDAVRAGGSAVGAAGMYTVTAYLNATRPFSAYQRGDTLSEYTADGRLLRLVFRPTGVTDLDTVAEAAYEVGNRHASDDLGHNWPSTARSLSVGDVLAITAPDGTLTHHSIEPVRFALIQPPTTVTLTFPLTPVLAAAEHATHAHAYTTCAEESDPSAHLCLSHTHGTLASNALGPHTHTVHAHGPGTDPAFLPSALTEEGLFHAVDLLTPTDDAPDLYTALRYAHAEGDTRFLITYDPGHETLTTTTD